MKLFEGFRKQRRGSGYEQAHVGTIPAAETGIFQQAGIKGRDSHHDGRGPQCCTYRTGPTPADPESAHTAPDAAAPATQPAAEAGRPADAVSFNGHSYKIFDEELTFHEAKKRCEVMGGYLACIETKEEQDFIAKLADGVYLYLGATDEENEGEWKWVNGSPWKFTAWYEGQPNNYGDDEHYLATYDDGDWVDVAAEGSGFWMPTGYICEWER